MVVQSDGKNVAHAGLKSKTNLAPKVLLYIVI